MTLTSAEGRTYVVVEKKNAEEEATEEAAEGDDAEADTDVKEGYEAKSFHGIANGVIVNVDGKDYILEKPLHANVALIHAWKADKMGNLVYRRTARNFNPIMATAADFVIVEAEQIVEVGELDPDIIHTPGCLVDMIVQGRPTEEGHK